MRRALIRDAGPYGVYSRSDGALVIEPVYAAVGPEACREKMQANRYCPRCDCYHIYGFLSRMALAGEIEKLLNKLAKPGVGSGAGRKRRKM